MKKVLAFATLLLLSGASLGVAGEGTHGTSIEKLALQHDGRVKTLLTFSRETLFLISGKKSFEGRGAVENILSLFFQPNAAIQKKIIPLTFKPLRDELGVAQSQKYFSLQEITGNPTFITLFQSAAQKKNQGIKRNALDNKVLETASRLEALSELIKGESMRILPPLTTDTLVWNSLADLGKFDVFTQQKVSLSLKETGESFLAGNQQELNRNANELISYLRSLAPGGYPSERTLNRELFYEKFQPFQKAWIAYFAAFLLFVLFPKKGKFISSLAWGTLALGFIFHTGGLALRILIGGRAPVSNMYESILFLAWALMVLAIICALRYRSRLLIAAGCVLGFLTLVIADLLPISPAVSSLVPVLRSNYWLTIHVLIIVSSYGAFALAMGIGHFNLGLFLFAPHQKDLIEDSTRFLYRIIQVGLILLIAGTILGGVWANESWGRFWGWDPKETWALISILGYLVIVHGRFAGWLKDFGLAIGSLLGFLLILMTYYGVNFILGQGLHSYGFGSGGTPYVVGFLVFETLVIGSACIRRWQTNS